MRRRIVTVVAGLTLASGGVALTAVWGNAAPADPGSPVSASTNDDPHGGFDVVVANDGNYGGSALAANKSGDNGIQLEFTGSD